MSPRKSLKRASLACAPRRGYAAFVVLLFAPLTTIQSIENGSVRWWVTHGAIKIRPADAPPARGAQSAELYAARNEFEPFQVVLRGDPPLEKADVDASDLKSDSGAVIPKSQIAIYMVRWSNVKRSSWPTGGEIGEWPDALVPKTDRYQKSRRNAFPFDVPRGRNQPVWVEIYVPLAATPGRYSGELRITAAGRAPVSVPVNLTVWNFVLPSTSSLPTSFGFNGVTALKQHRGGYTNDDELRELSEVYTRAALMHRLSTHGGTLIPPSFVERGDRVEIDWRLYDREVGPFLDGTVFGRDDPLPGAKATSIELRTHGSADSDHRKILYWREWVKHFREKGWFDRLYNYVWDEPAVSVFPKVAEKARLAHKADPRIRNLVTASLHPTLAGAIDIWCPLVNCFESKPGFPDFCEPTVPFDAYRAETRKGKAFWWYQSCVSHGCTDGAEGKYFQGWPSYVVDVDAVGNRIMGWLSWRYRADGELYFATNDAYGHFDPWDNIYLHSGNGDGTLFYPGTPKRIGGSGHIPIESIRLKLIREGLEDYEYLKLLATHGRGEVADRSAAKIAKAASQWESQPHKLYLTRQEMGERLSAIAGSSPPAR